MVNILANVGIILMAVYFYLRTSSGWHAETKKTNSDVVYSIVLEVLVGIALLNFSTVIDGLRFDFRFLLFCFSSKYLDWKVTSSSILLLAIARFWWGQDQVSQANLFASILLAVALPILAAFLQNKWNNLVQLNILVSFCMWPTILLSYFLINDTVQVIHLSLTLMAVGYASVYVLHHFIFDLCYLILSASTDHLTGLKNVRTFHRELVTMEQKGNLMSMVVIDIDYFKDYNDCFGHDNGDATLRQLADLFCAQKIPDATFYRIGGEEFALLIENKQPEKVEEYVHMIQKVVAENEFLTTLGDPISLTVSSGVAHRRNEESLKKTLKRADNALYQAKRSGRNKVMVAVLH
ncbi:MAG: diguanylate cyclase [Trichococcus sp.]|nr:diguanylate cyclase [Trichococcus sp.]